jgi:hypothetical protein
VWKLIFDSVAGTSHTVRAEDCQDSHSALVTRVGAEEVLIAACADGAGSATHSGVGSKLACEQVVGIARASIESGLAVSAVTRESVVSWYVDVRAALAERAGSQGLALGDLATTLLVSVVGADASAFAQLGDGAIVVGENDLYEPVFWPEPGEYANVTTFLTSDAFESEVVFASRGRCDELALLTDGLQRLALDFNRRGAHVPFFSSMFAALRTTEPYEDLFAPLRTFLSSESVNARTDDDKTLILATRRARAGAA